MKTGLHCERCRHADRQAARYTPVEYDALVSSSGQIIGERDGLPVIEALFILRAGVRQFADMAAPCRVHWNTPTFRCPWARPAMPAILAHGPDVFTPSGVPLDNDPMLDAQGHFRRSPHCPIRDGEYYVRPVFNARLPRQEI